MFSFFKFIDGRIYIQTGKVLKPAQVIYHDLPPEPPKIPNNDPKINAKQKQFVSSTITNVVAEQLSKTEVCYYVILFFHYII